MVQVKIIFWKRPTKRSLKTITNLKEKKYWNVQLYISFSSWSWWLRKKAESIPKDLIRICLNCKIFHRKSEKKWNSSKFAVFFFDVHKKNCCLYIYDYFTLSVLLYNHFFSFTTFCIVFIHTFYFKTNLARI